MLALLAVLLALFAALFVCADCMVVRFLRRPPSGQMPDDAGLAPEVAAHFARARAALADFMRLPHEELTMTTDDGVRLCAHLFPTVGARDTVIFVHGYRSSPADFALMLPWYRAQGFNLLLTENRGHGESGGDYAGFGAPDRFDCIGWCTQMAERFSGGAVFLHGISMGAATVTLAAGEQLPEAVRGVVADCGYTSAAEEFAYVMRRSMHLPPYPLLWAASLACRWRAGYLIGEASPIRALPKTDVPFLFVHGAADDFVPTAMAGRLYAACPTEKRLLLVEGAPHGGSHAVDPAAYEAALADFYTPRRTDVAPQEEGGCA